MSNDTYTTTVIALPTRPSEFYDAPVLDIFTIDDTDGSYVEGVETIECTFSFADFTDEDGDIDEADLMDAYSDAMDDAGWRRVGEYDPTQPSEYRMSEVERI